MMTINRRQFLTGTTTTIVGAMALSMVATPAFAADVQALSQENLDTALASGRPIAIRFYETWCPNCTQQGRVLNSLVTSDPRYDDFIVLEGVFSDFRGFANQLGIRQRTSVVVFKDGKFVDSVVGETRESGLRALLNQAL